MKYKKHLKKLLSFCSIKYCSLNGEEIITLKLSSNLKLEISLEFNNMDIVVEETDTRTNFRRSNLLNDFEKVEIDKIILSSNGNNRKIELLSNILFVLFNRIKM